ncbi:MAG: PAS domain-containing protein, partial [bacterium]
MTESTSNIKPMHWVVWSVLLVSAFVLYPWAVSSRWVSNSDVHALLELWAAFTALTAGLIIIIHYFANGSWLFLIISLGFVLQGSEDLVHALFSFSRIWGEEPKELIKFVPGTYAAGRFILIACVIIAWFLREKFTTETQRIRISMLVIVLGIAASTLSTIIIIKSHLPSFILEHIVTRPADFILIPFYLLAAALYKKEFRDAKYHTPFVFSIICSLIFGIASQIYVAHSRGLYDSLFDMAHLLKIFSYVCPILGVSVGTFSMYKKEAEYGKALAFSVQKEKELTAAMTLASIGDAVIATDTEGMVTLINRVAEELTGWLRDDVTGKPLSETFT